MAPMPTTLADLEARVAALEAEHADYRAVLTAINALAENQREHAQRLSRVETKLEDTNARVRSIEESVAEVKDLIVRALDQRP